MPFSRPLRTLGALLPSLFWVARGASFAFPGAEGVEAEFPEMVPRAKGVWVNERFFGALMLALIAAGYGAQRRRRRRAWVSVGVMETGVRSCRKAAFPARMR